jgi:hypothetical protein
MSATTEPVFIWPTTAHIKGLARNGYQDTYSTHTKILLDKLAAP